MAGARSIGTSAVVAAAITHSMVFSAINLSEPFPISTYRGLFQHILFATERLWSYAHGWQPMSHIADFGLFYALTVHLICPLIGFAIFWIISGNEVGINFWKPMAIALLPLTIPSSYTALMPGYAVPWVEVARTIRGAVVGVPASERALKGARGIERLPFEQTLYDPEAECSESVPSKMPVSEVQISAV